MIVNENGKNNTPVKQEKPIKSINKAKLAKLISEVEEDLAEIKEVIIDEEGE